MRQRRPTMLDVAREAGVALKTVSRVVNREAGVRPETAERVMIAVRRLGFRRNDFASKLRAGRPAASIGLVIEDLGNPFYGAIARGVERVTHPRDYLLITASSEEDPDRERELVVELSKRRVDGIIIVPTALDHGFLLEEIEMGLQVVSLDRPAAGVPSDTVLLDNIGGASAATEHLLELGHRRVAVVGHAEQIWTMQQRVAGYRSALAKASLPYDDNLVRLGPHTPAEAASATNDLLGLADPPTAFFACNNRMTVGVLTELQRRRAVADVAGFDEIETAALLRRPIALVTYDAAGLGMCAAQLLLERLEGRQTSQEVVVPTRLLRFG